LFQFSVDLFHPFFGFKFDWRAVYNICAAHWTRFGVGILERKNSTPRPTRLYILGDPSINVTRGRLYKSVHLGSRCGSAVKWWNEKMNGKIGGFLVLKIYHLATLDSGSDIPLSRIYISSLISDHAILRPTFYSARWFRFIAVKPLQLQLLNLVSGPKSDTARALLAQLADRDQGCQMVCFQTKKTNLDKFWRALEWKMLVYI
jgi:hypothetical protein